MSEKVGPQQFYSQPSSSQQPLYVPLQSGNQQNHQNQPLTSFIPHTFVHKAPASSTYATGLGANVYGSIMSSLGTCLGVVGTFLGCCGCNPYREVGQGFVAVKTRFGKYTETVDPGLHYANLLTESLRIVDVKMQLGDIPRQSVITKDNVLVNIDSVVYWHIISPFTAVYEVSNVSTALIERTMTTLRQIVGSRDLQDLIVNREGIAIEIEQVISGIAKSWGVKIESILIKDIQFSQELQENLSAAAKARRLAAARIIQAESEVESAKLLREASDILDSRAAMQIRYLDTLRMMAKESGAKVIFMPPSFDNSQPFGVGASGKPSDAKKGQQGMTNAALMDQLSSM